jgi:putative ABC transport system ATP-binding protein
LIELSKLSRSFDVGSGQVRALVDVDEAVTASEHVAIMGPSGSGKSTLLNILGCLDRPTSGSYRLDGREVATLDEDELNDVRRNKIGFVFQFFHLVPRLTAVENVELPMMFAGVSGAERRRKATASLERVGLLERVSHRPEQLSGGERQRVAIARATVMEPKLLLADEPTGNLDSASGGQVLDLLDQMNDQGLTIIVVTHDIEVAKRADRAIILADGRIVRRLTRTELEGMTGIAPTISVSS